MIELPNLEKRKQNLKNEDKNNKITYKECKDKINILFLKAELEIFDVQNQIFKLETNLNLPHEMKSDTENTKNIVENQSNEDELKNNNNNIDTE